MSGLTEADMGGGGGNVRLDNVVAEVFLIVLLGHYYWLFFSWSMRKDFIRRPKCAPWLRTSMIAGYLYALVFPIVITAFGAFADTDFFAPLKVASVAFACLLFQALKFHFPRDGTRWVTFRTVCIYGIFIINIAEAVYWEYAKLGGNAWNYINATSGVIQLLVLPVVAYCMRTDIDESELHGTMLRSNLSVLYICVYTLWNIEYNAVYHPTRAAYYIWTSLVVPFFGALTFGTDWLELRAHTLLGAALVRLGINADYPLLPQLPLSGTENFFRDEYFRMTMSILALVSALILPVEAYYVWKHKCSFLEMRSVHFMYVPRKTEKAERLASERASKSKKKEEKDVELGAVDAAKALEESEDADEMVEEKAEAATTTAAAAATSDAEADEKKEETLAPSGDSSLLSASSKKKKKRGTGSSKAAAAALSPRDDSGLDVAVIESEEEGEGEGK